MPTNQDGLGNCPSINVADLLSEFTELAPPRGYITHTLGHIIDFPLVLLEPSASMHRPHVLVTAGTHGDEPAGVLAILHLFKHGLPEVCRALNISFMPLVNPTGICRGTRGNVWGQDPNRGYTGLAKPSVEGEVILHNLESVLGISQDGFLALHEDVDMQDSYYVYTFEKAEVPGPFSLALRDAALKHFKIEPDGPIEDTVVHAGIIFNHNDGSLENRLFLEGIQKTACTETPGRRDLNERIQANITIIKTFAEFSLEDHAH